MRHQSIGLSSYRSEPKDRSEAGCRTEGGAGHPTRRNRTLTVAAASSLSLFTDLRGKAVPGVPQDFLPVTNLEAPECLGGLCKVRLIPSRGERMAKEKRRAQNSMERGLCVFAARFPLAIRET